MCYVAKKTSYAPRKSAFHTREGPIAFSSWLHLGYPVSPWYELLLNSL